MNIVVSLLATDKWQLFKPNHPDWPVGRQILLWCPSTNCFDLAWVTPERELELVEGTPEDIEFTWWALPKRPPEI